MINSKGWLRRCDEGAQDQFVTTDLDTLATALYAMTDDLLKESPQLAPCRPETGIGPKLSDAELITLAVMQALPGFTSEARWLRHARAHLSHLFPYLPQQPGYNKRLRAAASMIRHCIRILASTPPYGPMTSGWSIQPRSSAAGPARPPSARTWPDGPNTGMAPVIRGISGAFGCTWCAPCRACLSPSP